MALHFIDHRGVLRGASHRGELNRTDEQQVLTQHGQAALDALPPAPAPNVGGLTDHIPPAILAAMETIRLERSKRGLPPIDEIELPVIARQWLQSPFGRMA